MLYIRVCTYVIQSFSCLNFFRLSLFQPLFNFCQWNRIWLIFTGVRIVLHSIGVIIKEYRINVLCFILLFVFYFTCCQYFLQIFTPFRKLNREHDAHCS